jgi:dihydrofolate reductase
MPKLRVHAFTISLDGYGAGPDQSLANPLGVGGKAQHTWYVATRTFQQLFGREGGTTGVDDNFAARGLENIGAWILGRNMFGPVRGPWPDETWKGWWGDNPPYHAPTFVLTHHPREPIVMEGGTTFHFVTDGIVAALERARAAAGELDVKIGGGVSTVRQYLQAGLVDEMHFALSPVVLGRGEAMFAGLDLPAMGFKVARHEASELATHVVLAR